MRNLDTVISALRAKTVARGATPAEAAAAKAKADMLQARSRKADARRFEITDAGRAHYDAVYATLISWGAEAFNAHRMAADAYQAFKAKEMAA